METSEWSRRFVRADPCCFICLGFGTISHLYYCLWPSHTIPGNINGSIYFRSHCHHVLVLYALLENTHAATWPKSISMKKKTDKQKIADLEECLAGFMGVGAMNGMYLSPEMVEWCQLKLRGATRTPVQVWREITNN